MISEEGADSVFSLKDVVITDLVMSLTMNAPSLG